MNHLKSFFIPAYMLLIVSIAVLSIWEIFMGYHAVAWTGASLTSLPMLVVFTRLMVLKDQPRTSGRLSGINVLGAAGVLMAGVAWLRGEADLLPFAIAISGWAGFWLYAYWYSDLDRKISEMVAVGTKLPQFELIDVEGAPITSSSFEGKPTIMLFYRGNWCPLCMAQIKELASSYNTIESLGVRVALVSPQPHENTIELAGRFDVNFEFLTDLGNRAARSLGIESENGVPFGMQMMGYESETVLPTVIITDAAGTIIWLHETDNYRIRPEPELFLKVLHGHGISPA